MESNKEDVDELISQVNSTLSLHTSNPTPILSDDNPFNSEVNRTLILKVIADRAPRRALVKESLSAVWKLSKNCKVLSYGEEHYRVTFDNRTELERIIKGAPWLLDGNLVALERCQQRTLLADYKFDKAEFWVQLHDIPFDMMKKEIISGIANAIGRVQQITQVDEDKWSSFARVRVEVDITKPLITNLSLPLNGREEHRVRVRYEKLPNFCCFCGIIGHVKEFCCLLLRIEDALRRVDPSSTQAGELLAIRERCRRASDFRAAPPSRTTISSSSSPARPSAPRDEPPTTFSPAVKDVVIGASSPPTGTVTRPRMIRASPTAIRDDPNPQISQDAAAVQKASLGSGPDSLSSPSRSDPHPQRLSAPTPSESPAPIMPINPLPPPPRSDDAGAGVGEACSAKIPEEKLPCTSSQSHANMWKEGTMLSGSFPGKDVAFNSLTEHKDKQVLSPPLLNEKIPTSEGAGEDSSSISAGVITCNVALCEARTVDPAGAIHELLHFRQHKLEVGGNSKARAAQARGREQSLGAAFVDVLKTRVRGHKRKATKHRKGNKCELITVPVLTMEGRAIQQVPTTNFCLSSASSSLDCNLMKGNTPAVSISHPLKRPHPDSSPSSLPSTATKNVTPPLKRHKLASVSTEDQNLEQRAEAARQPRPPQ